MNEPKKLIEFTPPSGREELLAFSADRLLEKVEAELASLEGFRCDFSADEKEGKSKLAYFRKLADNFNAVKKAVKKNEMAAYSKFESELKRVFALIDSRLAPVAEAVEAFDRKRVDTRRVVLLAFVKEATKYFTHLSVELDSVFVRFPNWGNKTTSDAKIMDEMVAPAIQRAMDCDSYIDGVAGRSPMLAAALIDWFDGRTAEDGYCADLLDRLKRRAEFLTALAEKAKADHEKAKTLSQFEEVAE